LRHTAAINYIIHTTYKYISVWNVYLDWTSLYKIMTLKFESTDTVTWIHNDYDGLKLCWKSINFHFMYFKSTINLKLIHNVFSILVNLFLKYVYYIRNLLSSRYWRGTPFFKTSLLSFNDIFIHWLTEQYPLIVLFIGTILCKQNKAYSFIKKYINLNNI